MNAITPQPRMTTKETGRIACASAMKNEPAPMIPAPSAAQVAKSSPRATRPKPMQAATKIAAAPSGPRAIAAYRSGGFKTMKAAKIAAMAMSQKKAAPRAALSCNIASMSEFYFLSHSNRRSARSIRQRRTTRARALPATRMPPVSAADWLPLLTRTVSEPDGASDATLNVADT